jgi:hypothetical protein
MRESKKSRANLVYLKSNVGKTARDGRYKQYEPLFFPT